MSAERKIQNVDEATLETEAPLELFALRQQVAERLAAHRSRRSRDPEPEQNPDSPRGSKSRIAAAVAERYAQSKSYHAFLAEEAERAVREAEETARQAEAAAEIAARNAEALAQVQYDLLTELDQYAQNNPPSADRPQPRPSRSAQTTEEIPQTAQLELEPPPAPVNYTVRHAEDLRLGSAEAPSSTYRNHRAAAREDREASGETGTVDPSESFFLDEEIAFRQSPVFDPVEPPVEIPGNLIEFPRQLIASRRARPRLAEGPLREEAELHADPSQLRIFEVEAEKISPEPAAEGSAPEWSSILLDAQPRQHAHSSFAHAVEPSAAYSGEYYAPAGAEHHVPHHAAQHLQLSPETQHLYAVPLKVAPLQLRLMSTAVDACIVLAAFLVFTAAAVFTASQFLPAGVHMPLATAAISSAGVIALLGLIYQLLFFTFTDATPGMRYARIGLCTFSDENPTRSAMRRRIFAVVLSSASLGLGVLWALLDDERLGWHDRISRIYQRSY